MSEASSKDNTTTPEGKPTKSRFSVFNVFRKRAQPPPEVLPSDTITCSSAQKQPTAKAPTAPQDIAPVLPRQGSTISRLSGSIREYFSAEPTRGRLSLRSLFDRTIFRRASEEEERRQSLPFQNRATWRERITAKYQNLKAKMTFRKRHESIDDPLIDNPDSVESTTPPASMQAGDESSKPSPSESKEAETVASTNEKPEAEDTTKTTKDSRKGTLSFKGSSFGSVPSAPTEESDNDLGDDVFTSP